MARSRRSYICTECGSASAGWAGQCPSCQAWASIEEVAPEQARALARSSGGSGAEPAGPLVRPLAGTVTEAVLPMPTGLDEVDRVLGGGLTPGSVTLLGGEPGVGKSTLTLQLAMKVARRGAAVVVVAAEEAPAQIATRATRLGQIPPSLSVIDYLSVGAIVAGLAEVEPEIAIVDSIQAIRHDEIDGPAGSVSQVRAVSEELVEAARRLNVSLVLVGHVTKEGSLAGPKAIEHLVDTVLSFDGDRSGGLRYLRPVKHRFGSTAEVGLFDMTPAGLEAVTDPSQRFLADRRRDLVGSVVVPVLEGRRPVLVEIQALVATPMEGQPPRAQVQGVDARRLAKVTAVLTNLGGMKLGGRPTFVSATAGAAVTEPAADLALATALVSSYVDKPLAPQVVVCGEIGLGGELRSVPELGARLNEAYRLGFRAALVPASAPSGPTGLNLLRCGDLAEALRRCSLIPSRLR